MLSLTGEPVFDEKGMLQKGVIVRHLLLPGHKRNAREEGKGRLQRALPEGDKEGV